LNREKILSLAETQSEYSVCVRLFMCICFLGFDVTKSSKSSSHDSCSLANSCDNDATGTELVGNTGSVGDHSFKAAEQNSEFTIAEELKYAQRYEEGYDLPNPHYKEWLRQNHPEVAIRSSSSNCTPPTPNLLTSHLTFEAGTVSPVQVSDPPLSVSVTNDSYDGEPLTTLASETQSTTAEETKYMRRYEEGYDLPDSRYEEWLRLNLPEATDPNVEQSTDSVAKVQALSEAAMTQLMFLH